jgi:hypothetical protein
VSARSVIVSVPHGTSAGNMLRQTELLRRLREFDPELTVALLTPMANDPAFVSEFQAPHVDIVDLPPHQPRGLEARLLALTQASYLSAGQTESVRIRLAEARASGSIRRLGIKALLGRALVEPFTRHGSRYALSDLLVSHPAMERVFARYRPSLVVVANPGLVFSEVPVLRTARRRRIPAVALDASWDNFTNKLIPVRQVDRLIVWNEIMKRQAVELHGYQPDTIRVTGAPQFDVHFRHDARSPRSDFFSRINANPTRKLITLTTTPRSLYQHHPFVLRVLADALRDGRLSQPAQVLVRLHPRDDADAYREFQGVPHVIVEKPFRETVKVADGLAVDVMPEHQRHLGDTLCYSDVVVNVASTIAIEACIFDTPVVNICFDDRDDTPYVRSARRYYSFTHYVNITNRQAVRVAQSPDEMIQWVNRYLDGRSLDAEGRRRVVMDQCQFTDGKASERAAACVLERLSAATGAVPGTAVSAPQLS